MKYIKIFLVFLLFLAVISCSTQKSLTQQGKSLEITTDIITNAPLDKEEFIKKYDKTSLTLYNQQDTIETYNKLLLTNYAEHYSQEEITKNDIVNVLGTPDFIKNVEDYEIWQYRSKQCIINFIWINIKDQPSLKIKSYNINFNPIDFHNCITGLTINQNSNNSEQEKE